MRITKKEKGNSEIPKEKTAKRFLQANRKKNIIYRGENIYDNHNTTLTFKELAASTHCEILPTVFIREREKGELSIHIKIYLVLIYTIVN